MKSFIFNIFVLLFPFSLFGQDINTTVEGNSKFAFELYKTVKDEKKDENLFFSPFSISAALAMTYAGAREDTELEMSKTLHFSLNQEKTYSDFNFILKKIIYDSAKLSIANSLWAQKGYIFSDDYFKILKTQYDASLEYVDFIDNKEREKARITINEWVENKTNNKIKELLIEGALKEDSRLVLVNAIYFLEKWDTSFNPEQTKKGIFYPTSNRKIESSFMNNTLNLRYFEDEKLQSIEIPYQENKFSMIMILPKSITGIEYIEDLISYDNYIKISESFTNETVELSIPKFKTTTNLTLAETLKKLGMNISFSDYADFSGMTGHKDLKIDKVIHQAFIDVTEEGTEAAAATAVAMTTKSMMQNRQNKIFKADHPFLFLIKEKETGTILFMGKIVDPN